MDKFGYKTVSYLVIISDSSNSKTTCCLTFLAFWYFDQVLVRFIFIVTMTNDGTFRLSFL